MYRMLVIDDEHHVVDWLYRLFTALDEPEIDVYRAYSAYQALDLLERTRIDIVLSDINMPGKNGIELMETIYRNWPHCKVILITGYNEFDYAYKAIKYNAVDYILKTEDDKEIIEAVRKAIKKLENGLMESHLLEKVREQEGMLKYLIRMKVLFDFKNKYGKGMIPDSEESIYHETGFNPGNPVLLAYGVLDELQMNPGSYEYIRTLYGINLIFENFLPEYSCCILDLGPFEILAIIQPLDPNHSFVSDDILSKNKIVAFIGEMLDMVQTSCKSVLDTTISIALNGQFVEWGKILDTTGQIRMYLRNLAKQKKSILVKNVDLPQTSGGLIGDEKVTQKKAFSERESLNMLSLYLKRGQKSEFMEILDRITRDMSQTSDMDNLHSTETYLSITLIFISYFEEMGECRYPEGVDMMRLMCISGYKNWEELICCIRRMAEEIFSMQSEFVKQIDEKMLLEIKEYVLANISQDISLNDIAEYMFYNPSYLSRIFRQTTGMKLFDWIMDIRIKKAQNLLVSTGMSVNEICTMVGFKNPQHFATVFRKNLGMSPSECRGSKK